MAHDPRLGLDALAKLPLLSRAEVREHLDEICWPDCPGRGRPYNTGGSSGEPLKFLIDRARESADWAARWQARAWWGVFPGARELLVWGAPRRMNRLDRLRYWRDRLLNQEIVDAFNMTDQAMAAYLARIRELRPDCLYGYAGSLALLARQARQQGLGPDQMNPGGLRAIFATAEVVSPADRAIIQAAFGAPVVVEYGSRECGFIAGGCEAGVLHAAAENVLVELLDSSGRPVQPGQVGEIVVTCLESFATPLIRYRIGDLGVAAPAGECACGHGPALLTEVRGRTTDQIACRDGDSIRYTHALALIYCLREADGLEQFRIVQESLDQLCVEVVANARFTASAEALLLNKLRQRMGAGVSIQVQRRQAIEPGPSGKHACVISRLS